MEAAAVEYGGGVKIWQPFGVELNRTKDLEDFGLRQGYL
jgi:hypothetical protein